jgi:hypothetical protein
MAHEQPRCFRRGHNWRSGLEGRISGLKLALVRASFTPVRMEADLTPSHDLEEQQLWWRSGVGHATLG